MISLRGLGKGEERGCRRETRGRSKGFREQLLRLRDGVGLGKGCGSCSPPSEPKPVIPYAVSSSGLSVDARPIMEGAQRHYSFVKNLKERSPLRGTSRCISAWNCKVMRGTEGFGTRERELVVTSKVQKGGTSFEISK